MKYTFYISKEKYLKRVRDIIDEFYYDGILFNLFENVIFMKLSNNLNDVITVEDLITIDFYVSLTINDIEKSLSDKEAVSLLSECGGNINDMCTINSIDPCDIIVRIVRN